MSPLTHNSGRLQRNIQRFTTAGLLLTALLVGLVTLLPMYLQLREEAEQRADFDTRLLAQSADHLFERLEISAAQLGSRTELRNALERHNRGEITQAELEAFSVPRLQDALVHATELVRLVRLDDRGQPVVGLLGEIPAEHWPVPDAGRDRQTLSAPLLLDGQPLLLIGTPIHSREGRHLGSDIAAFQLERIGRQLSALPLHPATHSHLIHLGSRRIMHMHADGRGMSEAPANCPLRVLLHENGAGIDAAHALPVAEGHLAFVSPLPEHPDWAIALLAESDQLYAEARDNLLWPLLGILLLTVGGGVLTRLAIRPLSRRIAEQAQSLELAASVFDCSNEGVVLMDNWQRVIALNPAASRLTGHDPAALGELSLDALLAPEDSAPQSASLWARAAHSGHWLGELPMRRADGSTFHAWLSLAAVYDEQRQPRHFAAVFADISDKKAEEARIRQMAYHDRLTGLPNRTLALDRLGQALLKAHRQEGVLAVLFLDLDRFKPVNDTFGHDVGDHLLQAAAERLQQTLREADTLARLGGDEFLIVLEDLDGTEAAGEIAGRLVEALHAQFRVDGHHVEIGCSIGVALYPQDGEDASALVRSADAAMYRAKEGGRDRYAFHHDLAQPESVV